MEVLATTKNERIPLLWENYMVHCVFQENQVETRALSNSSSTILAQVSVLLSFHFELFRLFKKETNLDFAYNVQVCAYAVSFV